MTVPRIALRPDSERPDELDDIVVHDVTMFRAEAMDNDVWWMACYFANGEQVTFHIGIAGKPKRIRIVATDTPGNWEDIDVQEDRL